MGEPKGLLTAPGGSQTILERLVEFGRGADLVPFMVGDSTPYSGFLEDLPRIPDDPPGAGPLGGLRAAVCRADQLGQQHVIAVGCDMPHVTIDTLVLLRDHPSESMVLSPRRGPEAPWEPMFSRYDALRLIPALDAALALGCRSFQQLFSKLDVSSLELTPAIEHALDDWDTPADVVR